jgi:predicted RecA/RadA family phage recombinase
MKTFVQNGDVVTVTAPANVSSGDGVLVGALFGIAAYDADMGAAVEMHRRGVYDVEKAPSQGWSQGDAVYWDSDNDRATTVDTGVPIGAAAVDVGSGASDTTGRVVLIPTIPSGGS